MEGDALKCAQGCVKRHQRVNVAHEPRKHGQLHQELEVARLQSALLTDQAEKCFACQLSKLCQEKMTKMLLKSVKIRSDCRAFGLNLNLCFFSKIILHYVL